MFYILGIITVLLLSTFLLYPYLYLNILLLIERITTLYKPYRYERIITR